MKMFIKWLVIKDLENCLVFDIIGLMELSPHRQIFFNCKKFFYALERRTYYGSKAEIKRLPGNICLNDAKQN